MILNGVYVTHAIHKFFVRQTSRTTDGQRRGSERGKRVDVGCFLTSTGHGEDQRGFERAVFRTDDRESESQSKLDSRSTEIQQRSQKPAREISVRMKKGWRRRHTALTIERTLRRIFAAKRSVRTPEDTIRAHLRPRLEYRARPLCRSRSPPRSFDLEAGNFQHRACTTIRVRTYEDQSHASL